MRSTVSMNLVLRDNEQLRAEVADLTRRIRLALRIARNGRGIYGPDRQPLIEVLRKPLSRRTKAATCPESSVVAWGARSAQ